MTYFAIPERNATSQTDRRCRNMRVAVAGWQRNPRGFGLEKAA
jgi:hypothetical protein